MLLMDEEVTSGSELALPPFAFYLVSYLLRVNDIALYKVVMEIVCKMCRLTYAPIAPSYTYAKVMMSREIVCFQQGVYIDWPPEQCQRQIDENNMTPFMR